MGANNSIHYYNNNNNGSNYPNSVAKNSSSSFESDDNTNILLLSSSAAKTSANISHNNNNHSLFLNGANNETTIGSLFKDKKLKKLKQKIKTKLKKCSYHSQVFNEFAQQLSLNELAQIYNDYRATFFMKELYLHAENARPIASSIRNDLIELYDSKYNSDITLVYKGVDFPVHKAIVCVRCPYFRETLGKQTQGSEVTVNLEIDGLRVELFNDLLKYLYSGELAGSYDPRSNSESYEALIRISQQCGVPNPLSHDLRHLLETGIYSDASLCFQSSCINSKWCNCYEQQEYPCHQAILSARSPFFRNVITRQLKRNTLSENTDINNKHQRMKIILDESIIPRRLARILLHVMYCDSENLLNLIQSSLCKCNHKTSSSSLTSATKESQLLAEEIMNLYEIARFLELDYLVQSCEDMIINYMNLDTIISILKWSEQSYGSPWVRRKAMIFIKEEFASIISQPTLLYQLDYNHLNDILRSDFLEASELDIFKALIKWAEYHVIKQQEEREPNLLLSHSLTRKSIKKKEINDDKLVELISDLIDHLRIGHCLPTDSDFLINMRKRNIIQLPSYIGIKNNDAIQTLSNEKEVCHLKYSAWLRNNNTNIHFRKFRFFTHYFEECKQLLEDKLQQTISLDENIDHLLLIKHNQLNHSSFMNTIPDNLYMLEKLNIANESSMSDNESVVEFNYNRQSFPNFQFCLTSTSDSSSAICYEDVDKLPPNLPILDEKISYLMHQREQELRTSPFCIRALQISHSRCEALRLIQLRVVREFGLPDISCEVLHLRNSSNFKKGAHPSIESSKHNDSHKNNISIDLCSSSNLINSNDIFERNLMPPPPPRPIFSNDNDCINNSTNSNQCDPFSYQSEMRLEELTSQYDLDTQFSSNESHRTFSDYMPDIAFVDKASSLSFISINIFSTSQAFNILSNKMRNISKYLFVILFFLINDGSSIMTKTNDEPCMKKWFDAFHSFVCVCNETYCDSFNDDDNISKEPKRITIFSSDRVSNRFHRSEHYFNNPEPFYDGETIVLNRNKTYQTILGFGAAFTDATGININKLKSTKLADNVMHDYFSSHGLRYSMARVPIAGSDFSTHPYTYDDLPQDVHEDFNLTYFKLTSEDFKYKIPFIQRAQNISHYPIKLMASPWSPPAWLKTNNHLNGKGSIKGEPDGIYYKTYALYLLRFLQEYQDLGIDFWGMTIQNEPIDGTFLGFKFNCNSMDPYHQRDFIAKVLGPLLKKYGFGVDKLKLMIMDDQRPFIERWANIVLSDAEASKYVSGIAFHWYMNGITTPDVLTNTIKKFPNYFLLSSEACEGSLLAKPNKVSMGNWERAESYAYDIITDLNHYTSGWIDWNMALDREGGPNWSENFVDAPIIINDKGDEYYKQPMYYSLAHFTRFIEPQSKRIDLIVKHNYLQVVAFQTPSNATVMIVLNRNLLDVPLRIQDDRYGSFVHNVKAQSIQTLVWY